MLLTVLSVHALYVSCVSILQWALPNRCASCSKRHLGFTGVYTVFGTTPTCMASGSVLSVSCGAAQSLKSAEQRRKPAKWHDAQGHVRQSRAVRPRTVVNVECIGCVLNAIALRCAIKANLLISNPFRLDSPYLLCA